MRELDNLRHEVTGKLMLPVAWSPLQSVDLATVPTDAATHPLSLFMEDTGWPYAALDDYIRSWDEIYYRPLSQAPARMRILDIQACFQVAHGSYRRREAMLWQKIDDANNYAALVHLLTKEVPPEHRGPGSYMVEALKYPRSMGEPVAADVGLVTPVLSVSAGARPRIRAASRAMSCTMSAAGRISRTSPIASPTSMAAASKSSAATAFSKVSTASGRAADS